MFNEGAGVTRTTDMPQLVISHYFLIMFFKGRVSLGQLTCPRL